MEYTESFDRELQKIAQQVITHKGWQSAYVDARNAERFWNGIKDLPEKQVQRLSRKTGLDLNNKVRNALRKHKEFILLSERASPAVLEHEKAHAGQREWIKKLQPAMQYGHTGAILTPLATSAITRIFDRMPVPALKKLYVGAAMVGALLSLPLFAEETRANVTALKKMIHEYGFKRGLKESLPLLKSQLSYSITPAVSVGIPLLRRMLLNRIVGG